jgi:PAS domain S-box-containing protein
MFRDHANELRLARVNGLMSAAAEKSPTASTLGRADSTSSSIAPVADVRNAEEAQDSNVAEAEASLGQADLLLLAAETKSEVNPARDAALELLADNSFDAILVTDVAGKIAYSNKAFTTLTGYDQSDVIGKSPKLLQGPGTDMKVLSRLKDSMQKGNGDYEGSAINYKKNGTPFIMHWRVVPVKVGGEIKAWVAIQREGVAAE